ncbi:MAG: type II toxin-antitoxin system VapC family toxin [Burkholderiales bacterium]
MPNPLVVDSGPFVAWLNARDKHHSRAIDFFKSRRERLVTTWPVLTEVCHLAPRPARTALLRWVAAGGATVFHVPDEQSAQIADLMDQYDDLPMDLADASLVWLSHNLGTLMVATMDRTDFSVYRGTNGRHFRNVFFS